MRIENFRENTFSGPRLGTFDVVLDNGMTICGYAAVKGKEGEPFIACPQESYTTKTGEKKYKKIIKFADRDRGDKFESLVLAELKREGHIGATQARQEDPVGW